MLQNYNNSICTSTEDIDFFIPYVTGLKYNISCAGNGLYNVELLNYSVYYPDTPPNQFSFNADNGSWHTGAPNADGIQSWTAQLAPGQHEVGIKIAHNGPNGNFAPCEAFVTLDLPQPPSAEFTFDAGCANEAVQFYASDTDGFQYEWYFINDDVTNHQPNPTKTLSSGDNLVSLTVTNKYGCSDTVTHIVNVDEVNLGGHIEVSPDKVCEGGSITLTYEPDPNTIIPSNFEWYHNGPSDFPYDITDVPTLEVTESGQYYVFVQDANGCWEYDTQAISVSFITPPEPPVVSGPHVVCGDSEYSLNVPDNEDLHYTWYLNGQPQPQWDGLAQIVDSHATPGNYEYTVFSEITVDGVTCGSGPASFTVNVVAPPTLPIIDVQVVSCSPYLMAVSVSNVQPGTAYYWSNGDTGPQTTMTHDGPIRVRAEVNNCSVSAQTDLPTDLEALAWVFPKGCYEFCGEPKTNPYLLGPLGSFNSWFWSVNHLAVSMDTGSVTDMHNLSSGIYSLMLDNGQCALNIASMVFSAVDCPKCNLKVNNLHISCVHINGELAYKIGFDIVNYSGIPLSISLTAPNGEGHFADNTLFLTGNGLPQPQVLYFYPQNGFSGGNVSFVFMGEGIDVFQCYFETSLNFPTCTLPRFLPMDDIFLTLAPNPAKDQVHVYYQVLPESRGNEIVVTDLFGRKLMSKEIRQSKGELLFDCSGLQAGTYMVVLQQQGNTVTSVQLVVE